MFAVNAPVLVAARNAVLSVAGGVKTLILDNFTDSDATAIAAHTIAPTNTPATSWVVDVGTWSISSNKVASNGTGGSRAYCNPNVATATLHASITVLDVGAAQGIMFRRQDSSNYWVCHWIGGGTNELRITKVIASSGTNVKVKSKALTGGQTYAWKVMIEGSTVKFYVDGVLELSATGQTELQTQTRHGMHAGSSTCAFDNYTVTDETNRVVIAPTDYASNPVLADSTYNRRDPSTIILSGGVYYTYYTRYAAAADPLIGSIYYATASALHGTWTEQGEVIAHGAGGAWDEKGTLACEVIVVSGTTYLFYRGDNGSNARSSIGVASASSPAGPFTKSGSNPILQNSTDGAGGAWEDTINDNPYPLQLGDGTWRLYYKGRTSANNDRAIGYATTSAANFPISWTKYGSNPIYGGAGNESEDPSVLSYSGRYLLYNDQPITLSPCNVVDSADGIGSWGTSGLGSSVLVASMGAWASVEVGGYAVSPLGGQPTIMTCHGGNGGTLRLGLIDLSLA